MTYYHLGFPDGFPSEEHYELLNAKGHDGRVSPDDLWKWHAYDYGWRRIMLQTREDRSPIDPERKWLDLNLVAVAEVFYARKFNRRAPDLSPASRAPPTAEEIAHVERCVRVIVANIEAFSETSRNAFSEPRGPGTVPWQELQKSLGASAKPARWHDDDAVRLDARKLGLIDEISER